MKLKDKIPIEVRIPIVELANIALFYKKELNRPVLAKASLVTAIIGDFYGIVKQQAKIELFKEDAVEQASAYLATIGLAGFVNGKLEGKIDYKSAVSHIKGLEEKRESLERLNEPSKELQKLKEDFQ